MAGAGIKRTEKLKWSSHGIDALSVALRSRRPEPPRIYFGVGGPKRGSARLDGGQTEPYVNQAIENLLASSAFPNMQRDRRGMFLRKELRQIVIRRTRIHVDQVQSIPTIGLGKK